MPNDFLISLFRHKAWCNEQLVAAFRAVPADADRMQLAVALFTFDHTARVDQVFRARLEGKEVALDTVVARKMPDLDVLEASLRDTDAWYIDYATRATQEELTEVLEFQYVSDSDTGRMTRGEILAHIITHGASHRGAVGKMFETMKVPGAPDMVTTFSRAQRGA